MKELPCKDCIIQPTCTKKCDKMEDYRDHLFDIGPLGNSTIYLEYYNFNELIRRRRYPNNPLSQ